MSVDLNVDIGERPGEPEELYRLATVVNVACGGHAGDDASMTRAVELARNHGARIAAHPSYPDREGFGRKTIALPAADLAASITEQCASLARVANRAGMEIVGVKPHGALYHDAASSEPLATLVLEAVFSVLGAKATFVVGPPGPCSLRSVAGRLGARYVGEGFADRGYDEDGRLRPRGQPGALLTEPREAAEQAAMLVERGDVETLCVHSDTPDALRIARAVHDALESRGLLATHGAGP